MVPPSVSPPPRISLGDRLRLRLLHVLRLGGPLDRLALALAALLAVTRDVTHAWVRSVRQGAYEATRARSARSQGQRVRRAEPYATHPATSLPRRAWRTPGTIPGTIPGTTPASGSAPARPAAPVGSALYHHIPHPHTPRDVNALHHERQHGARASLNTRIAVWLTKHVGTMNTAYVFSAIGIGSLVGVFTNNVFLAALFGSVSSYFLQLVLLPILSVGQNVLGQHAELQAEETYRNTVRANHEARELMEHLSSQDDELLRQTQMLTHLVRALAPGAFAGGAGAAPNPLRSTSSAEAPHDDFAALHTAITDGLAQADTAPVPVVSAMPARPLASVTPVAVPVTPSPAAPTRPARRRKRGKGAGSGASVATGGPMAPTALTVATPAPTRSSRPPRPAMRAHAAVLPEDDDEGDTPR